MNYSILLNGSPKGYFRATRGLRQGDTLSPYLFIICMEVLSRLLHKNQEENLIYGFKVGRTSPEITHLLFADDIFIFCRANISEGLQLVDTLKIFAKITGQSINYDKSCVQFSKGNHPRHINILSKILKIKKLSAKDSYLGAPLFAGRTKTQLFEALIERVSSRIKGWKSKMLSQAGRTVLIKSITNTLPIYQMICFIIPKNQR